MTSGPEADRSHHRARSQFSVLLRLQFRLAWREPYGLWGIALPVVLLVLFWYIGTLNPGTVAGTPLSILDLYIPTILVIGYIALALIGMPVTFARDREIGWLRRVSTTPVPPSRLLAAQLILNVIVAGVTTGVVVVAGAVLFGAPLRVGLEFVGVATLAIAELFSLGLVVAAIAPSQQVANVMAGGLFFPLLFFSGLWVQPVQVGGPLETIMFYFPAGAAVRALVYAEFNVTPPYGAVVAMVAYTVLFTLLAVRYFRWE